MSRSRLPRNLLLAVMLVALAPTAASAQPVAPAAATVTACLPTCGSAARAPGVTTPHPSAAAITVQARHATSAVLVRHRVDLSGTPAATARPACLPTCGSAAVAPRVRPHAPLAAALAAPGGPAASSVLVRHRLDPSGPAAPTARPCLPNCGSAAGAPSVRPHAPSAAAIARPANRPGWASGTAARSDASDSGALVQDAAMLGLALLIAGGAFAAGRRMRPL